MIPGTKTSTLHLINKRSDFPSHKSILRIKKKKGISQSYKLPNFREALIERLSCSVRQKQTVQLITIRKTNSK